MIGNAPGFLRLRLVAAILLSLLWATTGSAFPVAERSDFGRSSLPQRRERSHPLRTI
jgi:hypothetical protein